MRMDNLIVRGLVVLRGKGRINMLSKLYYIVLIDFVLHLYEVDRRLFCCWCGLETGDEPEEGC